MRFHVAQSCDATLQFARHLARACSTHSSSSARSTGSSISCSPDRSPISSPLLPALPIIGIFAAIGRYLVEEQDEYVRMLMVRQTLWASGFALSVATIWGFLENFGLVGHVDGLFGGDRLVRRAWASARVINKLTLGAAAGC